MTGKSYINLLKRELEEERQARKKLESEMEELRKISSEISSQLSALKKE